MKIYSFADESSANVDEQIQAMLRNGLDGLEIRNVDGVNVADITEEKAHEVKAKMDAAGLTVWSIGSPIGKIEIGKESEHIEKFKHVLKVAKILGAENIRLFSLHIHDGRRPDECTEEVISFLKKLLSLAEGSGVTLCHENEKDIFGDVPERCLIIHSTLPEIKAVFDPANYIQCGADTKAAWELLKPYVKYLHIKDALPDGNVVPAGKGVGNLPAIVKEFTDMGGSAMTLEPHLHVFTGLAELESKGQNSIVGEVYSYASNELAFDAAAAALKELI